ncbi:MAG: tRNA 5-methoxyuridine(34)/uridine 5-oxyacetic acid(34) synthase CmoB [Pseudomonadota bacterium]
MQFQSLFDCLHSHGMSEWQLQLEQQLTDYFADVYHGDYSRWQQALAAMPTLVPTYTEFNHDAIVIGQASEIDTAQREQLFNSLQTFLPWRKGPFNLFGIEIDTEWRSDWKWKRLQDHIKPLKDKMILDVGCGNGYYAWRMLGQGAEYVVGIDPTLLFYMQFRAIKSFVPNASIDVLPFGVQHLPDAGLSFDTVFSMGVIYHRRDPITHLEQLKRCLKPNGELVLETLVLNEDSDSQLEPQGRYAKMNNVHAIPGLSRLSNWLTTAGFENIRIVDVTATSIEEQRCTDWMQFESLANFLDKQDRTRTIEGHPAPVRAIVLATNL